MITTARHLKIGFLTFDDRDQIDPTGPFEVLARIPTSNYRFYGTTNQTVRDIAGLELATAAHLAVVPASTV